MKEDIVVQVFRKYLESIGKRGHPKPKTAAGPDFVVARAIFYLAA
jgi:hypothetical protein